MKWWRIYALLEPETGMVRYVGYTHRTVEERIRYHIWDCRRQHRNGRTRKAAWIRGLLRKKKRPIAAVLQVGYGDWHSAEQFWIAAFRNAGMSLLNMTVGGKGRMLHERKAA